MQYLIEPISWLMFLTGSFLTITGGVGLLRLPDFFSRIHAAGITETLATPLLIGALILQLPLFSQESLKLLLIILFVMVTNPTAAHSMAKAALHGGEKPLLKTKAGDPPSKS